MRRGMSFFPRAATALLVAAFATFAAIQLFVKGNRPEEPLVTSDDSAGRMPRQYLESQESTQPAPYPILISLSLETTSPVLQYLEEAGVPADQAVRWASVFRSVANTDVLHKDHALTLYKDPENGDLRALGYDLDKNAAVREESLGNGVLRAWQEVINYDTQRVAVAFEVNRSFRAAAQQNSVPAPIVATLENAFEARRPLNRLPTGATVKLIYQERVSRDGTYRTLTGLEAAEIRAGKQTLTAFAFRDERGRASLYDDRGEQLGPQFLRFPLAFKYISSGFTFHRYHPLLHEYRPHMGVDLVTNYGAPVKSVADGRVVEAGWCGELGRCVRIAHAHNIATVYGHLARVNVAQGEHVQIGQVIGLVGSSGLSTGPHLHFGLAEQGRYVDPLTHVLGANHQVSPRMHALFNRLKGDYLAALESMPDFGSHFTVGNGNAEAPAVIKRTAKRNPGAPAVIKRAETRTSTRHPVSHQPKRIFHTIDFFRRAAR